MSALTAVVGDDGVLVLTLDVPGEPVNTLSRSLMNEMDVALGEIEGRLGVTAVVLQSGKPDGFIAGADIRDFGQIRSAIEAETLSRGGQAILDRLEALPFPVVAAIHGAALGGGLEVALACRYRIATDDPKTVLGVPEVQLGLIPGAGGTQRLPRLVGVPTALDLVLTGRSLKAARALKAGLVDEVVPKEVLLAAARRAALGLASGTVKARPRGLAWKDRLLLPIALRKARASVLAKGGGHYPAPLAALDAIAQGVKLGQQSGLKVESRHFGELAVSDVSRSLVSVFFATQEIKKDAGYPEGTSATTIDKLAVVGAGLMGAGIAASAAEAGALVRLKDAAPEALGRALAHAYDGLEERRRRGSLDRRGVTKRLDRLSVTTEPTGFRQADLVIEAVFEDVELKRKVLAETEALTPDECVFASNTSSLPIGEIARDARRPSRVLGMHFFSPVEKMPLLEVVVTSQTDAWATATAVTFGRRLGKHVIVVRDGPGFYTTRTLAPYLNEACRLVEEGAAVEDVDRALVSFGFPVGPLALLDEVGIDVGAKVAHVLHHAFGERLAPPESMARVVEDGRQGRKNGRGFYAYGTGQKRVDASVYALLPGGPARRPVDADEIRDRCVFAFLNEAVLCLQDGVLRSARDGDVGAIFGLGFPPFLGGPFRYLDHLGARFAAEVLDRLAAKHGERFRAAPRLQDMAKDGGAFHQAVRAQQAMEATTA
jgi:3-hydroxyacyl-CoA dehydrogenase / enoyl-CoA hydratase / 3-hydroxybutyryl-CoA epimerase